MFRHLPTLKCFDLHSNTKINCMLFAYKVMTVVAFCFCSYILPPPTKTASSWSFWILSILSSILLQAKHLMDLCV